MSSTVPSLSCDCQIWRYYQHVDRQNGDLISKFQIGLESLLRQGLSEPAFYGDLVDKLKKIIGSNNFSAQFIEMISYYNKIIYNINVLQQLSSKIF